MEKEINIADILRDKSTGTKLYSPAFGECILLHVNDDTEYFPIIARYKDGLSNIAFRSDGKYVPSSECILFPSSSMRNWQKFAWKKGDVLVSNDGKTEVLFEKFKDENYTSFVGRHALYYLDNDDTLYYNDVDFYKTDFFGIETGDAAQCYINTIEERLDGKLNMETLEIEPAKPKWTPKPFDKILTRDRDDEPWTADFFSHKENGSFVGIGGSLSDKCIPYNEETARLIGTTKSLEDLK